MRVGLQKESAFGSKNRPGEEFVAKLLWFGWDAGARGAFAQPGGVGLKVLQAHQLGPLFSGAVLL